MIHRQAVQELLVQGLSLLDVPMKAAGIERLLGFLEELERWNPAASLVGATGERLVTHHLLDSLAAYQLFCSLPAGSVVADLGSGAGLPGIPLAVALPALRFLLVDRSIRRCAFLRSACASLGIGNAEVMEADARRVPGSPAAITFRAVFSFPRDRSLVRSLAERTRMVVMYKARLETVRRELADLRPDYDWIGVYEVRVPFLTHQRHLVVLRR